MGDTGINTQTIKCLYNQLSVKCHSLETTLGEITDNCFDGSGEL